MNSCANLESERKPKRSKTRNKKKRQQKIVNTCQPSFNHIDAVLCEYRAMCVRVSWVFKIFYDCKLFGYNSYTKYTKIHIQITKSYHNNLQNVRTWEFFSNWAAMRLTIEIVIAKMFAFGIMLIHRLGIYSAAIYSIRVFCFFFLLSKLFLINWTMTAVLIGAANEFQMGVYIRLGSFVYTNVLNSYAVWKEVS